MTNQAVILAGGKGTRLGDLTKDTPKQMLKIKDKFFLEYIIEYLFQNKIDEIIIVAGYLGNMIYNQFHEKIYKKKLKIKVILEPKPLGTGGFIREFNTILKDKFFLINGDTIFNVELDKLTMNLGNSQAIIALKKVKLNSRYGNVILNKKNEIIKFENKKDNEKEALINGGVYLIRRSIVNQIHKTPISIEKDVFPMLTSNKNLKGHVFKNFFIDIGIENDLIFAQRKVPNIIKFS